MKRRLSVLFLVTLILALCNRSLSAQGQPTPTVPATQTIPVVTANSQWTPQYQTFNGVEMALAPPGCFTMGTENPPSANDDDEKPTTRVCFDEPFWIDRTEVTQAQFRSLGGQAAHGTAFPGDNRPVERITWFEARDFCVRRGARLPTEAEWEYAARGPDDLIYPWGNTFAVDNAVYWGNSSQTADVGSKPAGASWVGAYDLSGNVWEWTNSLYRPYPYDANDGRENSRDMNGFRTARGGSWLVNPGHLRAAVRYGFYPSFQYFSYGFRCARSF